MFHMQRHRRLPEEHARFYSAEIALALNYLHERGTYVHVVFQFLKLVNLFFVLWLADVFVNYLYVFHM